jgi:tRNA A37 threonylcarbamoyladenosine biosynthesis protein TsaE
MIVQTESDTKKVAEKFANSIPSSCVICLNGDLGAGKNNIFKIFDSIINKK